MEGINNSDLAKEGRKLSGYRNIFKATSIFGGVQAINILITIIRGKILAILIGTTGMGLNSLLISSLTMIQKASGLGLGESAIRDISQSYSSGDKNSISRTYTVFRRWIWLSALIGVVLTISLSPVLSRIAFNEGSYTSAFMVLSVTFIFGALTGGIYALLRGMRRIKDLALANISGSFAGLLVAIPIFYFYRIDGVVPAIIASGAATYLVSIYFRKKINLKLMKLTIKETFFKGKQMAILGITLTISALISSGIKFILNAYITRTGSLTDLGIYNAGYSIMFGYVGMVFTAMGTDYYPRLSGSINEPEEWKEIVNQQAETTILILGPILCFVLLSAPLLIRILLSPEFMPSIGFIIWASMAIILRAITWVSSFVFIAKGDNKIFLITEMIAQVWFLTLNLIFFNILGITGLGISMFLGYLLSIIMMFIVLKKKYDFILSAATYKISMCFLILIAIAIVSIIIFDYPKAYVFILIPFIIISIVSLYGLNKRMNLKKWIRNKIKMH